MSLFIVRFQRPDVSEYGAYGPAPPNSVFAPIGILRRAQPYCQLIISLDFDPPKLRDHSALAWQAFENDLDGDFVRFASNGD
jgi:hypothetical protein